MQTVIASQYSFDVPKEWKVLYGERDIGVLGERRILRSWLVEQGERTLSVYLNDVLSPEEMADVVGSQTRQRPKPKQVEINGLAGTHLTAFVEGWGRIEYWLKQGREMICFCIQGPDIRSQEDAADMEEVVKSVRLAES